MASTEEEEEEVKNVVVETINITSMTSAEEQIMKRKAHITAFQEPCMRAKMLRAAQAEARKHNRTLEAGPLDLEHGRTSGGVSIIAQNPPTPMQFVKSSEAYEEAVATGRCLIRNFDFGGTNLVIAILYGWAWGKKGNETGARTDDLLTVVGQ